MRRVCSWCGASLDETEDTAIQDEPVTHGICPKCRDFLINNMSGSLTALLDQFDMPVLLVDENATAREANSAAYKAFGKDRESVADSRVGAFFQCVQALRPGGCGKTVHCAGCQIRISINRTHQTGESLSNVEAYQDVETVTGIRKRHLRISTEKIGDFVLLRIDGMEMDPPSQKVAHY